MPFVVQYNGAGDLASVLDGGGSNSVIYGRRILVDTDYNLNVCGIFYGLQTSLPPLTLYEESVSFTLNKFFVAQSKSGFTAIKTLSSSPKVIVYLIPSKASVTFICEDQQIIEYFEVFDLSGKKAAEINGLLNKVKLSIKHLMAGVYVTQITTSKGQKLNYKIIREE